MEEKAFRKTPIPQQERPGRERAAIPQREVEPLNRLQEIYSALVLGTRDYTRKNGFRTVLIGLSGGIDSALTSAIAVDALGKEGVVGVSMPSQFSSRGSIEDARLLAENLNIRILT